MRFGKTVREKCAAIRALVRFQNSVFYPVLFAILCTISGISSKDIYIPVLIVICCLIIFSALFTDDNKVFFVPMLMIYYALGNDTDAVFSSQRGEILSTFEMDGFVGAIACGIVMAIAVFSRLIADGTLKRALKKRGLCFWSIISLDAVILLNGIFSDKWVPINLLFGVICCIAITVFYFLTLSIAENSRDPVGYACKTLVCTSFVALVQVSSAVAKAYFTDRLLWKSPQGETVFLRQALPWGVSTIVGMVICLGIPAALYLAMKRKYSVISYFCAFLLWGGTWLIDTRAAIAVGGVMLLVGVIICCVRGENRIACRIYTLIFAIGAATAFVLMLIYVPTFYERVAFLIKLLRFDNISFGQRSDIWLDGIRDFLSAPIFGVGFRDGGKEIFENVYSSMYHSVVIQFLGSMGLVGLLAFLIHIKHLAEILIRRFSAEKFLLMMIPFGVICASLVDNYFFYPNFQIIYSVFLGLAEHSLEKSREQRLSSHKTVSDGRKPRVVFTYVEAGKGHIVPEGAVCESFKKKYSDEFEVVESCFYTETGDKKLEKTEKLFASAVKRQNKSRILSLLCRTGNWLCGDTFALYFLMCFTFSGMQSKKRARAHLRELDADMIFTTHWATAFYAAGMKEPPYTVMLCPDAYSNGMFNVDVNDFLIPSKSGKKDAEKLRMYAGGEVRAVGFPIRNEAVALYGKKAEIRESLGIAENEFVVTMSDGGYGLANMEATVDVLLKSGAELTVIVLCGTNEELYRRLNEIRDTGSIRLIPVSFTNDVLKYVAAADLFCGKSGANSMAEPAFFGVPIIVTRCITYIERGIKNYYVKELGGAMYIPIPSLAAKKIIYFSEHREELKKYSDNLSSAAGRAGTDEIADLLYERLKTKIILK